MSNPYDDYKWEVHVTGPDDVMPADNFQHAVHLAAEINACAIDIIERGIVTNYHPVVFANIVRIEKACHTTNRADPGP